MRRAQGEPTRSIPLSHLKVAGEKSRANQCTRYQKKNRAQDADRNFLKATFRSVKLKMRNEETGLQLAILLGFVNAPKMGIERERGNFARRPGMRRIGLIERDGNQSGESTEHDEDNMVLKIGFSGSQVFVLKGKTNNQPFTSMIDSSYPKTIFNQADLRELLCADVMFARPMPKTEQYVDYNNKSQNLLGFTMVNVKVGKRTIENARILSSRDGKISLIRRIG